MNNQIDLDPLPRDCLMRIAIQFWDKGRTKTQYVFLNADESAQLFRTLETSKEIPERIRNQINHIKMDQTKTIKERKGTTPNDID